MWVARQDSPPPTRDALLGRPRPLWAPLRGEGWPLPLHTVAAHHLHCGSGLSLHSTPKPSRCLPVQHLHSIVFRLLPTPSSTKWPVPGSRRLPWAGASTVLTLSSQKPCSAAVQLPCPRMAVGTSITTSHTAAASIFLNKNTKLQVLLRDGQSGAPFPAVLSTWECEATTAEVARGLIFPWSVASGTLPQTLTARLSGRVQTTLLKTALVARPPERLICPLPPLTEPRENPQPLIPKGSAVFSSEKLITSPGRSRPPTRLGRLASSARRAL